MKYSRKSVTATLNIMFTLLVGLSLNAYAGKPQPTEIDCSVEDVQITKIQLTVDGELSDIDIPVNAISCLAVENVNNSFFNASFLSNSNLGYDNDGWLNQGSELIEWWDGPGAFIDDADLLDLDGDSQVDDPGWIYVGKDEGNGFVGETSQDDDLSYTFKDDLITFSNGGIGSRSGEWQYTPPQNNPQDLLDLLGGDFFDQVAVVFKAGNGFAMYNFTLADLGLPPILAGDFNYVFGGTWNIDDTLGHALSNMSFWARDPSTETVEVPEPSSMVLLLLSIILLFSRKKLIN